MFTTAMVRTVWLSVFILSVASCELGSPEDFEANEPEFFIRMVPNPLFPPRSEKVQYPTFDFHNPRRPLASR